MISLVIKGSNLPKDRNGKTIELNSEVLFKENNQIGQGKVIGYTENLEYVYIVSSSFYKVSLYKRIGKNVVIVKDLSKWTNSKGGWY